MNVNNMTALSSLSLPQLEHGNCSNAFQVTTNSSPLQQDDTEAATTEKCVCDHHLISSTDEMSHIVDDVRFPSLSWDDITVKSMIGRGGFSTVHLITLSSRATCPSMSESSQYALKRLAVDVLVEDSEAANFAAKDIAIEATILSQLPEHENIIRLHAVSTGFWENPRQGFLVLERLVETLDERIVRWRRQSPRRNGQKLRTTQMAPSIASAMEFLHSNKIIYRDLKPQNIGFDVAGTVRLFDFGLARIHEESERKLTGRTGSARYMAPEVARSQAYSFPADVHSYSILMWEVCTLQKAYANAVSVSRMQHQIAHGNVRPSLERIESTGIRDLLTNCWNPDPSLRPTFEHIAKELKAVAETCKR
jgi:serine/threonine protein kinase